LASAFVNKHIWLLLVVSSFLSLYSLYHVPCVPQQLSLPFFMFVTAVHTLHF